MSFNLWSVNLDDFAPPLTDTHTLREGGKEGKLATDHLISRDGKNFNGVVSLQCVYHIGKNRSVWKYKQSYSESLKLGE